MEKALVNLLQVKVFELKRINYENKEVEIFAKVSGKYIQLDKKNLTSIGRSFFLNTKEILDGKQPIENNKSEIYSPLLDNIEGLDYYLKRAKLKTTWEDKGKTTAIIGFLPGDFLKISSETSIGSENSTLERNIISCQFYSINQEI